ncbi:DUF2070 family protein [Halococcoides cellulosivorans]|uniref:DUF2070 domain-containing protein n=1 Tax=Halococcoides cellulosivorans TaxID=1679096 RepID=A0A2R4WZG8_9EURY|nr:DUF2070 family protein [Halococcoides cellulosivorans]AWB26938.1 DUF2070 domain-containing protein [Halococcoides cellulosivorans]
MTATQGDLASLSQFIFRAPRWHRSLTVAVVVAALVGVVAFDASFVLEDLWQGVFFVGIPTVVAGLLTAPIDRWFGGTLSIDRSALLAVVSEAIVVVMLLAVAAIGLVTDLGQSAVIDALMIALATLFLARLIVIYAVSRHPIVVAAIPASIQTVAAAALVFVYGGTYRALNVEAPLFEAFLYRPDHAHLPIAGQPDHFLLLGVLCGVYGVFGWLYLNVLDLPWRLSFGVSALDFVAGFLGHLADGRDDLEEFFAAVGDDALVPVTLAVFRRPDGTEKARFVLPIIHPGPMGSVGGGVWPIRADAHSEGLSFAPHATAGHDFNLVSKADVETILDCVEDLDARIETSSTASVGHRVGAGDATLTGHAIGDGALVVSTFAPSFADDVDYAVGLAAVAEARQNGLEDVALIDAHNSNDGLQGENLGHVVPGCDRAFDLIEGAESIGERLASADRGPLSLGTASSETPWGTIDGIGPLGIRVAVLDVDGQTTAYVLIDGNNMDPGLRDRIVAAIDGPDLVEVMTSDTHAVNTVEAENQVGDPIDPGALTALIDDLVSEALADCEPVEAGMASDRVRVGVFGNDRTEALATMGTAVVPFGIALASTFVALLAIVTAVLLVAI